jgi:hypothetical protein
VALLRAIGAGSWLGGKDWILDPTWVDHASTAPQWKLVTAKAALMSRKDEERKAVEQEVSNAHATSLERKV